MFFDVNPISMCECWCVYDETRNRKKKIQGEITRKEGKISVIKRTDIKANGKKKNFFFSLFRSKSCVMSKISHFDEQSTIFFLSFTLNSG